MRWVPVLAVTIAAGCGSASALPPDAAPPDASDSCTGAAGTFHEQSLVVDGETRYYYLHVPASYTCSVPIPVLIDFHGTGFDLGDGTPPEELWATPGLEGAADDVGFIAVRPRSQHYTDPVDGQVVYHWDSAPGDLERNKTYARALIDRLASQYNIDRARVYASGFSNGTNMVAQLVGDPAPAFSGFALIGGGIWDTYSTPLSASTARIYDTTGYRDQLRPESLVFYRWLEQQGLPAANLFVRETNAGHEVYRWQFAELFRWLDQGIRPAAGSLAAGWSTDGFPDSTHSVLRLAPGNGGELLASGTGGRVWRRAPAGSWSEIGALLPAERPALALDGLCATASGSVVTTGDGAVGVLTGATWNVNATSGQASGDEESRLESLACVAGTTVIGGGPSYAAISTNLGTTWNPADITVFGATPSVSSITVGPSGTWVAIGADYIGRSTNGTSYTAVEYPTTATWMYGVSSAVSGQWWGVGEAGTVLRSQDDGRTWTTVAVPTHEDLYAVRFFDASRGMAVGLHGSAILTTDGGTTWHDVSTGKDAMNSDVAWLDASTVLVVGGEGTVIKRTVR